MAATLTLTPAEMDRIASRIAGSRDHFFGSHDSNAEVAAYWLQALPLDPHIGRFEDSFCEGFCYSVEWGAEAEARETFDRGGINRAANWMSLAGLAERVANLISLIREGRLTVSLPTLNRIRVSFFTIVRDFRPDRRRPDRTFRATDEWLTFLLRADNVRPVTPSTL